MCKKEIEGKASLLVIPLDKQAVERIEKLAADIFTYPLTIRDEDLVRKIHICNPCMADIEEFIEA